MLSGSLKRCSFCERFSILVVQLMISCFRCIWIYLGSEMMLHIKPFELSNLQIMFITSCLNNIYPHVPNRASSMLSEIRRVHIARGGKRRVYRLTPCASSFDLPYFPHLTFTHPLQLHNDQRSTYQLTSSSLSWCHQHIEQSRQHTARRCILRAKRILSFHVRKHSRATLLRCLKLSLWCGLRP